MNNDPPKEHHSRKRKPKKSKDDLDDCLREENAKKLAMAEKLKLEIPTPEEQLPKGGLIPGTEPNFYLVPEEPLVIQINESIVLHYPNGSKAVNPQLQFAGL